MSTPIRRRQPGTAARTNPSAFRLFTCGAAAVVATTLAGPAQAIVGGTPTTAFGQVSTDTRGNGVQISANWVLTASHVGYNLGASYTNGFGVSRVAARYSFSSAAFPENDLSLLRLDSAIAAPQLSLLSDQMAEGTFAPIEVTIATGHNQSPRGYAFAELRTVSTLVDPDDAGPRPEVVANYLLTLGDATDGAYVQSGDSGGGLFLGHVTDSTSALLGITSGALTYTEAGQTRHGSAFVQLAAYRAWIDTTMTTDGVDMQMANWISAVPEPTTLALWLGGLALAVGARARRR